MRTTLTINDGLYEEAKVAAARRGTSVGSVIEDALADYLARAQQVAEMELSPLPVTDGIICPGIDINDGSALLELLDEGRPLESLR